MFLHVLPISLPVLLSYSTPSPFILMIFCVIEQHSNYHDLFKQFNALPSIFAK